MNAELLFGTWTGRWVLLGLALFLGGGLTMIAWIINAEMGRSFGAAVIGLGGFAGITLGCIMGAVSE